MVLGFFICVFNYINRFPESTDLIFKHNGKLKHSTNFLEFQKTLFFFFSFAKMRFQDIKQRYFSLMLITWEAGFPEVGHYV